MRRGVEVGIGPQQEAPRRIGEAAHFVGGGQAPAPQRAPRTDFRRRGKRHVPRLMSLEAGRAYGDVGDAAVAPVGVEQHERRADRKVIVHGDRQARIRISLAQRADPVGEDQRLVEGDRAVHEELANARTVQYPLESQERRQPVDVLVAAGPVDVEPIVERREVVRAQEHRRPAREPLVDQRAAILVRAAAEVVVEDERQCSRVGEAREQAPRDVEIIERRCRVVLCPRPAQDAPDVAMPQTAPDRTRQPRELAELLPAGESALPPPR